MCQWYEGSVAKCFDGVLTVLPNVSMVCEQRGQMFRRSVCSVVKCVDGVLAVLSNV